MSKLWPLKIVVVLSVVGAALAQRPGSVPSSAPKKIQGRWVFREIIPTPNIQGPSLDQQKKLLGSILDIREHVLRACGASTPIEKVASRKVSDADFLLENHISIKQLGIKSETITEIIFNDRASGACFDDFPLPGQVLYVGDSPNELIVDFEGVFYRARRKKS